MKIESTDNLPSTASAGRKNKAARKGEAFGRVLEKTIAQAASAEKPDSLQGLPPAGGFAGYIPASDRKMLVGRADRLLELLESYRQTMTRSDLPIQDAYHSMKAIEDRADELAPFIESLPEGDDFRDFLNRLIITASVEAIKFRRGDYL